MMFFIPAFVGVVASIAQAEAAKKDLEAWTACHPRPDAGDVIDVEARFIDDVPALPAPIEGEQPT